MRILRRALVALLLGTSVAGAQADSAGPRWGTSQALRTRFVRDQTMLGLSTYGPAFAFMVGRDGVTGAAGYLVMAGGSFFAAAELSRHVRMTEARVLMSTAMAVRGAGSALLLSSVMDQEVRTRGAIVLLGGLGGTATGLVLGGGLTGGEAAATVMGHDLAWATAAAITLAGDADPFDDAGVDETSAAVAVTVAGVGGYFAGRFYAGLVPHNLTAGDLQTLWTGATIGAAGAGAVIANSAPNVETTALSLLAGGWIGVIVAERTLVRWYDHTRGEANLVSLGGAAGGLMGVGVGVLVNGEGNRGESVTLGFATAGAVAGVAMTERYLQPARDAGRLAWMDRVRITPGALAAAAMRTPGRHSLVSFTF